MLEFFRNLGKSLAAKVLLILIALSFMLWGVSDYFLSGSDQGSIVAKVNGQKIGGAIFQKRLEDARARYTQVFGAAAAEKITQEQGFSEQILNSMINDVLLSKEGRHLGLQVPDAALVKKIESIPEFAENGHFSKSRYEKLLVANGLTPAQFEGMLRESMLLAQLQAIPQVAPLGNAGEAQQLWAWSQEYRDVESVEIPFAAFAQQAAPNAADIEAYYHAHVQAFQEPAQVQVQYVLFGPQAFFNQVGAKTPVTAAQESGHASAPGVSVAAVQSGDKVREEKARQLFNAQMENFKDRLFSSPKNLAAVAQAYGLSVEESPVLVAGQVAATGPFHDPKALALAFGKAVLEGKNSEAITLPDGNLLAVHLVHFQPARVRPLAAVSPDITQILTTQNSEALAKAAAQQVWKAAQGGKALASLTRNGLFRYQNNANLTRHNVQGLPQGLLPTIFNAPAPRGGVPSLGMAKAGQEYVVFAVTRVGVPPAASLNPQVSAQIAQSLEEQRVQLLLAGYLQDLRSHGEVKVFPEQVAKFSH
ncbi:MAG: peptidylprolyl isomerase [Acidithiobacillus sp.]